MRQSRLLRLIFSLIAMLVANFSYAAKPAGIQPFALNVAYIHTGKADFGRDNELSRQIWQLDGSAQFPLAKTLSMGVSLGAEQLDFQLKNITNATQGWDAVQRYRLGLSVNYRPDKHWMFLLSPKLQYAWADGAKSSDAASYGIVAAGMYRFTEGHLLGLGLAYLNDANHVRTFPYLAVRWQFTPEWLLANPFAAGFSGPAGLELRYLGLPEWQFGMGSAKRRERFLIATGHKQSAEIDEWVAFLRATKKLDANKSVSLLGGWYFNSEVEFDAVKQKVDSQVALGLTVNMKF